MKFYDLSNLLKSWGDDFSREDHLASLRSSFRNNSGKLSNRHVELHFRCNNSSEISEIKILGKENIFFSQSGLGEYLDGLCRKYNLALVFNDEFSGLEKKASSSIRVFTTGADGLSDNEPRNIDLYIARIMFAQYEVLSFGDSQKEDRNEKHEREVEENSVKIKNRWGEVVCSVQRLRRKQAEAAAAGLQLGDNFKFDKYYVGDYRKVYDLKMKGNSFSEIADKTKIPAGSLPSMYEKAKLIFTEEDVSSVAKMYDKLQRDAALEKKKRKDEEMNNGLGRNYLRLHRSSSGYSDAQKKLVCELRQKGTSYDCISVRTGIPRGSLYKLISRMRNEGANI